MSGYGPGARSCSPSPFALGLMFWQIRAAAAAQLIAIPPIGWAMWELAVKLIKGRWWVKPFALAGLAGLGSATGAYELYPIANRAIANMTANGAATAKPSPAPAARKATAKAPVASNKSSPAKQTTRPPPNLSNRCRTLPALQPLDGLPPALIFTLVDLGPRIIAVTHHSVIAGLITATAGRSWTSIMPSTAAPRPSAGSRQRIARPTCSPAPALRKARFTSSARYTASTRG